MIDRKTHGPFSKSHWAMIGVVGGITLFTVWGLARVPFHPDETSWLFASRDFETLLTAPTQLVWQANRESDPRQIYRELNAPLTPYWLGFARWLIGVPAQAVAVDWNWSLTWSDNVERGALPAPTVLWSARLLVTLLLPLSLTFVYRIGCGLGGQPAGLLAALLMGGHGLILLHARRAMAEGMLVFAFTFALWSLGQARRRPWLVGVAVALAVASKQLALALVPVGMIAVAMSHLPRRPLDITGPLIYYLGLFALVTGLLNPLGWAHPVSAWQAMWTARLTIVRAEITAFEAVSPGWVLMDWRERIIAMIAQVFFAPPAFAEVANYQAATAVAESIYRSLPGHELLRGWLGGSLMLALSMFGMAVAAWRIVRGSRHQLKLMWLWLASVAQAGALVVMVPLPIQRYYLPLVPLVCVWAGYALAQFVAVARAHYEAHV